MLHQELERGARNGWRCRRCAWHTRSESTRLMNIGSLIRHGRDYHHIDGDENLNIFVHDSLWTEREPSISDPGQKYCAAFEDLRHAPQLSSSNAPLSIEIIQELQYGLQRTSEMNLIEFEPDINLDNEATKLKQELEINKLVEDASKTLESILKANPTYTYESNAEKALLNFPSLNAVPNFNPSQNFGIDRTHTPNNCHGRTRSLGSELQDMSGTHVDQDAMSRDVFRAGSSSLPSFCGWNLSSTDEGKLQLGGAQKLMRKRSPRKASLARATMQAVINEEDNSLAARIVHHVPEHASAQIQLVETHPCLAAVPEGDPSHFNEGKDLFLWTSATWSGVKKNCSDANNFNSLYQEPSFAIEHRVNDIEWSLQTTPDAIHPAGFSNQYESPFMGLQKFSGSLSLRLDNDETRFKTELCDSTNSTGTNSSNLALEGDGQNPPLEDSHNWNDIENLFPAIRSYSAEEAPNEAHLNRLNEDFFD